MRTRTLQNLSLCLALDQRQVILGFPLKAIMLKSPSASWIILLTSAVAPLFRLISYSAGVSFDVRFLPSLPAILRPQKHTPTRVGKFVKPMQDDRPARAHWLTVRRTMHADSTCIPSLQSPITTFYKVLPVRIPLEPILALPIQPPTFGNGAREQRFLVPIPLHTNNLLVDNRLWLK